MRRIAVVIAAAALIAAAAPAARAGGGGGCHEDQSSQGTGTAVVLRDLCFAPTVIHIRPGDTITWTNKDEAPHTVTGMPGTFDSDDLAFGDTFKHVFADPGTYAYYCTLHRRMAGAVVVAGDIAKAGVGTGSTGTGADTTGASLTGSKPAGEKKSAAAPVAALAIPAALVLGYGVGRRRTAAAPS